MKKILSIFLLFSLMLTLSVSLISCSQNEERAVVEMFYGKPKLSAMSDEELLKLYNEYEPGKSLSRTEREFIAIYENDTRYAAHAAVSMPQAADGSKFVRWVVVNYYGLYEYDSAEALGETVLGKKRLSSFTEAELDTLLLESKVAKADFEHDVRGIIAEAEVAMFDSCVADFFDIYSEDYVMLDYVVEVMNVAYKYYGFGDYELINGKRKLSAFSEEEKNEFFKDHDFAKNEIVYSYLAKFEKDPHLTIESFAHLKDDLELLRWLSLDYYGLYDYDVAAKLGDEINGKTRLSSLSVEDIAIALNEYCVGFPEYEVDVKGVVAECELKSERLQSAISCADEISHLIFIKALYDAVNQYYDRS